METRGLGAFIQVGRKMPRKRIGQEVICARCGRSFLSRSGREKYCSHEECVRERERDAREQQRLRMQRRRR